jgi:hypothetical protein
LPFILLLLVGAKTLSTYSPQFARFSKNFEAHLTEAFATVTHKEPRIWAEQLDNIARTNNVEDEYWVGVSWMEVIASHLPQKLFDSIIAEKYKQAKL